MDMNNDVRAQYLAPLQIVEAITCIKSGGVLIYPTETVYGIGGDAAEENVIARVKQAKGRDDNKPMLILTDEWERAAPWIAEKTPLHETLMQSNLPITILFAPTRKVPLSLRGSSTHVGIRRTTHAFCRELIAETGCLLLSTSANPSGKPPTHEAHLLDEDLKKAVDLVVDAGTLPPEMPSTVVQIVEGKLHIIREGNISKTMLEELVSSNKTKKDITTRADLEAIMRGFYQKAIHDPLIGHYFTEVMQLDLEKHIPIFLNFWETSLFGEGKYSGNLPVVHQHLHAKMPFEAKHFETWLSIFCETVDELFEGTNTALIKTRAAQVAMVLQAKTCGF